MSLCLLAAGSVLGRVELCEPGRQDRSLSGIILTSQLSRLDHGISIPRDCRPDPMAWQAMPFSIPWDHFKAFAFPPITVSSRFINGMLMVSQLL